MSVEQTVRDFLGAWSTGKAADHVTADGMVSGGVLPAPMPAQAALQIVAAFASAMPDFKVDIKTLSVEGDTATAVVQLGGTQTSTLALPMPGMPSVPATGKKVSVPDKFIFTVKDDKIASMHVDSPADGGIPAMLGQLGVNMPNA